MKMKIRKIRVSIFCLVVLILTAPMLRGQDLSKYRAFSLGTNLATVLRHTDQKLADIKVIHSRPALIQELTWWPASLAGTPQRPDAVEQMLFSFYNGELYKMSVTYDRSSTEGLTAEDMVKSITAKYGPATYIALAFDPITTDRQQPVASWEDSQYSFNLVRSSFTGGFQLVIYSKKVNTEAELAVTEAAKLDEQEGPQREAERLKKETDGLAIAREKNQKSFHP
jgi:hypothetical protein